MPGENIKVFHTPAIPPTHTYKINHWFIKVGDCIIETKCLSWESIILLYFWHDWQSNKNTVSAKHSMFICHNTYIHDTHQRNDCLYHFQLFHKKVSSCNIRFDKHAKQMGNTVISNTTVLLLYLLSVTVHPCDWVMPLHRKICLAGYMFFDKIKMQCRHTIKTIIFCQYITVSRKQLTQITCCRHTHPWQKQKKVNTLSHRFISFNII